MADNNKRERDQRQDQGFKKDQKTSGYKDQKRNNNSKEGDMKKEERDQKSDRRR